MKKTTPTCTLLLVLAGLGACASAPQPAPAVTAAPATRTTPPVVTATAPAAPVASSTPDEAKETENLDKKAKTMGYHIRKKDDAVLYCRDEAPIGSRLTHSVCVSREGFAEMVRQAQEVKDIMNRGNVCVGATCQ